MTRLSSLDVRPPATQRGLVLVALLGLMALWFLVVPPGGQPDEPSHLAHGWGVATGQDLSSAATCEAQPCPRTLVDVPAGSIPEPGCFAFKPEQDAGCFGFPDTETFSSYMVGYPELYYGVVGMPMHWSLELGVAPDRLIYVGRLASLGLGALLLGWFVILRGGNPLDGALLALVPMGLSLVPAVNPSGAEFAASLLLVEGLSGVDGSSRAGRGSAVAVGGLVLAWSRPLGWAWSGLLMAAMLFVWRFKVPRAVRWPTFLAVLFAGTAFVRFLLALGQRGLDVAGAASDVERLQAALGRWGDMATEWIGVFGWLDTPLPTLSYYLYVVLLAALLARRSGGWSRRSVAAVSAGAAVFLGLTLLMYLNGFLWQGRYLLPLAALLPLVLSLPTGQGSAGRVGATLAGLLAVVSPLWVLGRFMYGLEVRPRAVVVDTSAGPEWLPPGGLTSVGLLASLVVGVWLVAVWLPARRGVDTQS